MEQFPRTNDEHGSTVLHDFVVRSKTGVWGQLLTLVLLLTTTGLAARAPALMRSYTVLIVGLVMARAVVLRMLARTGPASDLMKQSHVALVLLTAAVTGIIPGIALYLFGYEDKDVLVALLYHGLMAFAMVSLFVHSKRLSRTVVWLMFVPLITGNLLHRGPTPLHYLEAAALYILYCLVQGGKMHASYWRQLEQSHELSVAAYRDCLTGLPNRLYLNQKLESCVAEAAQSGTLAALLYIDIDGLKQINDQHSHKAGDQFLCAAAERIRASLGPCEIAARIGGDEFTVLMPGIGAPADALVLAHALLDGTRAPVHVDGQPFRYSASIGVSFHPHPAGNAEALMRTADEALRTAKATGRNRVCVWLRSGVVRVHAAGQGAVRLENLDQKDAGWVDRRWQGLVDDERRRIPSGSGLSHPLAVRRSCSDVS